MTIPPLPADTAPIPPVAARGDPVAAYRAAVGRLDALIQPASASRDVGPSAIRARAELRLERLRRFLASLGDPHRAYPVVHVGGTSGKGSTATAIAAILQAAGHRTGLHTSPYLQVATEKVHVGGRLVAGDVFAGAVDEVLAAADAWSARHDVGSRLTYGEVWFALTALLFVRERVDLAVIEVGAGGRFDLTNVVVPAVSVITSVGLDHVETLGETIAEIAWHKAGIVKSGAPAVTGVLDPVALEPIEREARAVGTTLRRVIPGDTFEILANGPDGTRWRERPAAAGAPFLTALPGRFQAANAAVAVAAVRALGERGPGADDGAIRRGLRAARIPGRAETMPVATGPTVVLDGAHNPQKMAALVADLAVIVGARPGTKPVVLLAALGGKDVFGMVERLASHAATIVATAVPVRGKHSVPPSEIRRIAHLAGFSGPVFLSPDPTAALAVAVEAASASGVPVLVTGSLYLVGAARGVWYPDDAIVRQRSPWPVAAPPTPSSDDGR